jgi:hypothetical protein
MKTDPPDSRALTEEDILALRQLASLMPMIEREETRRALEGSTAQSEQPERNASE